MKKIVSLLLLCLSLLPAANAQTIKNSSLQVDKWGWHKVLNMNLLESVCYGNLDGNIYFRTEAGRFMIKDSLYCYNMKSGNIVSKLEFDGFPCVTPNRTLKLFRKEFDKDTRVFKLFCDELNTKTLKTNSSKELFQISLVKRPDYAFSYSISPDSSKVLCLMTVETEKNDYSHYYVVYDLLTDEYEKNEISFKTAAPYYYLSGCKITDKGEMVFILKTYDSKKAKTLTNVETFWVDADKEMQRSVFKMPEKSYLSSLNSQILHNGNMVLTILLRNGGNASGDFDLYYNIFEKSNFENEQYHKYHFNDVWLEKQKVALKVYSHMELSYITELDNGKVMLTGFPYKILTQCSNNSCVNKNSWGGFFNLEINPDGSFEKASFVDRFAKKLKTAVVPLSSVDIYYSVFPYGNNLYLLYNESVYKVKDGKPTYAYKPANPAYITLYRLGEDGEKCFNLSGAEPTLFGCNNYLTRAGNKFYVLTRSNKYGSIGSFELPEVAVKDFTRRNGKAPVANAVEKQEKTNSVETESKPAPAQTKANPRNRSVKK